MNLLKAANPMTHKYLQILPVMLASLLMAFTAAPVNAQTKTTHPAPSLHEPAIDQLAAPIALYPDVLLAQLLMASTYPLDVAEAARWADRHPAPTPAAVAAQPWESSVKALLPFVPILTMLNTEKNWTRQLAGAVIKQPAALLDTIQALRERAYDNGALHPMRQWQVQQQDRIVSITPAEERRIYVPYYDPAKVYGAAGNSLLPPEYWAAQPYAAPQNKPDGIVFSTAIMVPDRAFYDAYIDWRTSRLMTRHTMITANSASTGPDEWQHDPQYRSRKSAKEAAASDTIGTEAPPPPTAIGTESPLQPGTISTRRPRGNGM
ncbi:MAG TPA: DUF3300 domain-containing protein [Herbaspirillum sp.]|nr:DUF3300 domain-containing protein [Herbaspirillum sp.]